MPFSSKSEYFELELANYTLNHIGELTVIQMNHENLLSVQFRGLLGSKRGGQKGQNVPFSRRNGYYELEFCNYKLNHV